MTTGDGKAYLDERTPAGPSVAVPPGAPSRREVTETDRDHKVLLFERHLVEKVVPLRIVVLEILHHGEAELAVGRGYLAVHGQLVAFRDCDGVPVLHVADHYIVDAFERDRRRRESAFPVVAAEVRYRLIVLSAFVQVEVGVVETVGYLLFRFRRFGEHLVIGLSDGYLVRHSGVAGRVHPRLLLGGEVLARKDIVERVVRVVADGEIVVALFEYVRALAVSVVGTERLFIHRHGKRLLAVGVGGEPVGLGKADELYRGLLYAVLLVILGIRSLDIHLHDFLAGNAAAVADVERNVVARFGLRHFEIAVLEGRIRQSVAERECDFLIVVPCLFVGRARGGRCALHAEDGILVARFVVSVTDVNAFLIHYVFSVVRPIVASVFLVEVGQFIGVFRPGEVAEVGVRRSGMVVVKQSVRRASRHDELVVTDKHVGDLGKAHRAALTYPDARVDAVLLLAYLGELHRVGGVEQEHRLFESARRFERLQVFEHARFFDGELEVVLDAAHHVVAHVL